MQQWRLCLTVCTHNWSGQFNYIARNAKTTKFHSYHPMKKPMINSGLQQANTEKMTTSQPTRQACLSFPGCSSIFTALYTEKIKSFDNTFKFNKLIKLSIYIRYGIFLAFKRHKRFRYSIWPNIMALSCCPRDGYGMQIYYLEVVKFTSFRAN